jgi:hypothetical protein
MHVCARPRRWLQRLEPLRAPARLRAGRSLHSDLRGRGLVVFPRGEVFQSAGRRAERTCCATMSGGTNGRCEVALPCHEALSRREVAPEYRTLLTRRYTFVLLAVIRPALNICRPPRGPSYAFLARRMPRHLSVNHLAVKHCRVVLNNRSAR